MQIGVVFDTCTNVVQYLSLERDNARRYLNTVYIGATGKKLWKLVRQANSTGKAVARIRNDPYKYVYAFRRISLHMCYNFGNAEHDMSLSSMNT